MGAIQPPGTRRSRESSPSAGRGLGTNAPTSLGTSPRPLLLRGPEAPAPDSPRSGPPASPGTGAPGASATLAPRIPLWCGMSPLPLVPSPPGLPLFPLSRYRPPPSVPEPSVSVLPAAQSSSTAGTRSSRSPARGSPAPGGARTRHPPPMARGSSAASRRRSRPGPAAPAPAAPPPAPVGTGPPPTARLVAGGCPGSRTPPGGPRPCPVPRVLQERPAHPQVPPCPSQAPPHRASSYPSSGLHLPQHPQANTLVPVSSWSLVWFPILSSIPMPMPGSPCPPQHLYVHTLLLSFPVTQEPPGQGAPWGSLCRARAAAPSPQRGCGHSSDPSDPLWKAGTRSQAAHSRQQQEKLSLSAKPSPGVSFLAALPPTAPAGTGSGQPNPGRHQPSCSAGRLAGRGSVCGWGA